MTRSISAPALAIVLLVGSASAEVGPGRPPAPLSKPDPIEAVNRHIYRFNAVFDDTVAVPVLRLYRAAVPRVVRRRFASFFDNLGQITVFANSLFQASPTKASVTLGRFAVNTIAGVGGLWDPASRLGLARYDEDFGQTLGAWGVGPGPYLVLPLLGPSSARDTTGAGVDRAMFSALQWALIGFPVELYAVYPVQVLQYRDDVPFHYGELGPFEYDLVRFLYLEYRAALVAN